MVTVCPAFPSNLEPLHAKFAFETVEHFRNQQHSHWVVNVVSQRPEAFNFPTQSVEIGHLSPSKNDK